MLVLHRGNHPKAADEQMGIFHRENGLQVEPRRIPIAKKRSIDVPVDKRCHRLVVGSRELGDLWVEVAESYVGDLALQRSSDEEDVVDT